MSEPFEYEPYPTQRQPSDRGLLRASDNDRDQVAQQLSVAFSEGRLTREEHDARLDAAVRARTLSELEQLTSDLGIVPLGGPAEAPHAPPVTQAWSIDTRGASENADTMIAVFGGSERRGKWRARRHISNLVLFGGSTVDMREATFEADTCQIQVFCLFGGIDIIVPEGVQVVNDVVAIFGGSDVQHVAEPQPGAPTVTVKGLVGFGGVTIKGKGRRRD